MTSLASGSSLDQKYAGMLGVTGEQCIPPPTNTSMLVIGRSNEGKSCFVQSCPGNFIINVDASSTTNPDLQAHLWPFVGNEDGRLYDHKGGEPITLTWEKVLEKVDLLCQMADDGWEGRPKMVTLDTVDTAIPLVQEYVVKHAKELRIRSDDAPDARYWNELHGPAAWEEAYSQITELRLRLRRAGYGVIFVMHLIPEKVFKLDDGTMKLQKNWPRVTENCWNRIYPESEVVVICQRKPITTTRVQKLIKPGTADEPLIDPKTGQQKEKKVSTTVEKHVLSFTDSPFIKKRRRAIEDTIVLSGNNGWKDYETAYYDAITAEQQGDSDAA